ncbi:ABC transporter substrate-binding protein [Paenibacillus mucilaginosus]|uniref:Extracellular solute-binding protein family 1 n=1 Tax=Paenibacillus mucilaginosus (strain KNP414) TaxID=1036673 RepID=F8FQ59_PAEMK|nr:ABC transporter substrate-binding protein [Paenibacillus mucilaginosus]AEI40279.1 extracellular solute-binding protein family 1 [Paenibacillus mucilaginosus KNP414]MCG7213356.1 ABC transporter substrate-binding protein [Paenibacillus mucilaginosus]WDM29493.1 ABC transporter substrate-binding protein [Paenibacillus mucilaginosus]
MKKNLMIACALVTAAALFLTACQGNGGDAPAANGEASKTREQAADLTVAFPIFGAVPKDLKAVQDAINQIAREKINATVTLTPISFGNWDQQANLMLSSNEELDLMYVGSNNYSNYVAKGQLIALDKLVEQYGQGIKEALDPAYLKAPQIAGSIYGIPTVRDFAVYSGIAMRKDLADKNGIDVNQIRTLDDVEVALKTIKENEPNITPLIPGNVGVSILDRYRTYDNLGDSIGVLPKFDNDLKIVNLYETEEYTQLVKKVRSWYTSGLILKDAATNKTTVPDLMKSNRSFAYMSNMKPGFVEQESKNNGMTMVTSTLIQPVSTTSNVTGVMWGIPINSKMPEKAMEFLNLMYADADIVNLLNWGIEGQHYVIKADNVIDFPDGVDAQKSGYNLNLGWLFGNQFLSYVFAGNDPEIWGKMDQFNKSAVKSKALGFTFDASSVKAEYAAVTNVITEYKLPLETGSVDPDKILPEFISKLKSAGIDKIIAEKQKQLNEWAKNNQ